MKKVLSFITVFAMLFALVIPASADDISLLSAGEDRVTVSYKAFVGDEQVTEVRPGDTVTITAYAKMTAAATEFTLVSLVMKYEESKLEPISGDAGAEQAKNKGIIYYNKGDAKTTVGMEDTEIFSYTFKIKDTAAGTTVIDRATGTTFEEGFTVFGGEGAFDTTYDVDVYGGMTVTPLALTITANEAKAYIGENTEIDNGRTYFAESVTVTAAATNPVSAKVYKGDAEVAELYDAETKAWSSVTLSGTGENQGYGDYTVVVKAVGVEKTYTFTLHAPVQAQIDNKISTDISKGVNRNGEITIPVKMDGLGADVKAAMVSFEISYDTDVFEFTSFDNKGDKVVKTGNKFVYGSESTAEADALANGAEVTSIVLKVKNDAKFGNTDVEFSYPDIALYAAAAPSKQEVSNQTLAIKYPKQTVTIVPTAAEAASFGSIPAGWAASKDITVTPAENVTLAYGPNDSDLAETADLAALFTAGSDVTDKLTADTEKYYYVIAKVGGETEDAPVVYVLVKTYTPDELQIDKTAPTVSFTDVPTEWVKSLTITSSNITVEDARGEVAKTEYFVGTVTEGSEWSVLTDAGIAVTDGTSVVTVRTTDTAGNVSAPAAVTVKVDGTAPTISAAAQPANNDNKVPIAVTASDATSGLKAEADSKVYAAVYFDGTEGAEVKTALTADDKAALTSKGNIELTDGSGEYLASESGIYYFVVSDNALNESVGSASVTITTLPEAKDLLVKTVKTDESDFHAGFVPNGGSFVAADRSGTLIEHNGWFTYVKAKADNAPNGYTNTIKYTFEDGNAVDFTADELANGKEFTAPGKYVVTVTTTREGVAADTKEKAYTFYIVGVDEVKSTTARNFYSMLDYARIKRLVLLNKTAADEYAEFWGGMFSGDLDGNLLIEAADLQPILDSLKNGEDIGAQYSIPIMNLDTSTVGE